MAKKIKTQPKTGQLIKASKTQLSDNHAGRPIKLTPEIQQIMVQAIELGTYLDTACTLAGISFQTMRNWQMKGEKDGKGPCFEFMEALARAEAKNEHDRVQEWRRYMVDEIGIVEETKPDGTVVSREKVLRYGDYRAVKDFLERRYHQRWGKKLDVPGIPEGGSAEITEVRRIVIHA